MSTQIRIAEQRFVKSYINQEFPRFVRETCRKFRRGHPKALILKRSNVLQQKNFAASSLKASVPRSCRNAPVPSFIVDKLTMPTTALTSLFAEKDGKEKRKIVQKNFQINHFIFKRYTTYKQAGILKKRVIYRNWNENQSLPISLAMHCLKGSHPIGCDLTACDLRPLCSRSFIIAMNSE